MIRTPEEFGRLLRQQRQAVGLTQDTLAARCGVTRRTIIDLEAGKSGTHLGKALMAAWEVGLRLSASPLSAKERSVVPLDENEELWDALSRASGPKP